MTIDLLSHCSRQWKNDPKGNLEIIKATSSVSKRRAIVSDLTGQMTSSPAALVTRLALDRAAKVKPLPQWVWKTEHWTEENFSWTLRSKDIYLLGTHLPFLFPYFSLLVWKCLSHAHLTIIFLKYVTYLVWFHRFTAGGEFYLRINCTLRLIYSWFR